MNITTHKQGNRRHHTSPQCCHLANSIKHQMCLILIHWRHFVKAWCHPQNCTVIIWGLSHNHN